MIYIYRWVGPLEEEFHFKMSPTISNNNNIMAYLKKESKS